MWYSYAIVRVVPRVERGEFLNVGVILFAREQDFCQARVEVDKDRLLSLAPGIDLATVERHLGTFVAICEGRPEGGPIAALQVPERFYWLVAPRSTMIQTSPVHAGRTDEPDLVHAVDSLVAEFVRLPAPAAESTSERAALGRRSRDVERRPAKAVLCRAGSTLVRPVGRRCLSRSGGRHRAHPGRGGSRARPAARPGRRGRRLAP